MLFAAFGSTFSVVTAPIHRRRGGALFSTAPAESESGTAVAATATGQYKSLSWEELEKKLEDAAAGSDGDLEDKREPLVTLYRDTNG